MEIIECTADKWMNLERFYAVCDCGWRSPCQPEHDARELARRHLTDACVPFTKASGLVVEPTLIGPFVGRYGRDNAEWVEVGHRVAEYLRGDRSVYAGNTR